jgi:hypothetical protein
VSDVEVLDIRRAIRAKLVTGDLPGATPMKCWVGKGTEHACMGCDLVISAAVIEYEVDLPGTKTSPGLTLRFHQRCLGIWHEERARLRLEGLA